MSVCRRLTKPAAKLGSSCVTLRNSPAAMSKVFSLSGRRPASQCCAASGDIVCHTSQSIRMVRMVIIGSSSFESWPLRFADFEELVRGNVVEDLLRSRRPEDLYLGRLGAAQPEMQPFVVGGLVAARRGCETSLCIHLHAGAKTVAVTAIATHPHEQPR